MSVVRLNPPPGQSLQASLPPPCFFFFFFLCPFLPFSPLTQPELTLPAVVEGRAAGGWPCYSRSLHMESDGTGMLGTGHSASRSARGAGRRNRRKRQAGVCQPGCCALPRCWERPPRATAVYSWVAKTSLGDPRASRVSPSGCPMKLDRAQPLPLEKRHMGSLSVADRTLCPLVTLTRGHRQR